MTATLSAKHVLQIAIKARLQAALPTWLISEKTPKSKKPPYIELYDTQIIGNLPSKTTQGEKLRMTIRAFDASENSDSIDDVIDDIRAAITDSKVVLPSPFFNYLQVHERTTPSQLQRDRRTWMGQTVFVFSIRQA